MEHCNVSVTLSQDHIILTRGPHTLWCNRNAGKLTAGNALNRDSTLEYVDLGQIWGIVGKIRFFTDGDWKLVVITQATCVGVLPHGKEVYCVEKIGIIPLTPHSTITDIIGLEVPEYLLEQSGSGQVSASMAPLPQLLGAKVRKIAGAAVTDKEKPKEIREREKVEKRLTEALLGMFNDSQSFYFCLDSDLTRSLQQKMDDSNEQKQQQLPLWKQVDERFFWNKWMISDLVDEDINVLEFSDPWILPLIQGYVEVRQIPVLCEDTPKILQPSWSERYREERGKMIRECEQRSSVASSSVEVEMKDLANVNNDEMMIPMKELRVLSSGSGYESDSDLSNSDDEFIKFIPMKTTDVPPEDEVKDQAVVNEGTRNECGRTPDLISGLPKGDDCTRRESPLDSLSDEPSKRTPYQSGDPKLSSASTVDTRENDQCNTVSTVNGIDAKPSDTSATKVEGVRESELSSTTSTSGSFYTSQEIPDLDGVIISILQPAVANKDDGNGNKGSGESIKPPSFLEGSGESIKPPSILDGIQTHGEASSDLITKEVPQNLTDASPMGNPFLEERDGEEPSWMRHEEEPPTFTLAIISRRSRYRAGTRYKRRGVDTEGNVANYVETELVLQCGSHVVSSVIVRGSVPVYWSQPGNKYRPLPVIENSEEETQDAFRKHFQLQLKLFGEMAAINLVKQMGREKLVGDAFEQHVILMDDPLLSYIAFDFHHNYKRNQSVAMQTLLEGTTEFIRKFKFCWIDTSQSCGPLCRQEGVFRVNCMDCLDRTNVVESILSREVLQTALQKLGMIPFDEKLGGSTLTSYQEMWANNGDVISKQYAGTAAMKGDITRYGERKLTGMMKDGYNSAHRYYLNVFRDSYRQVLIDLMQGVNPFEAFVFLPRSMQGMDELEDVGLSSLLSDQPSEAMWSLEKEDAMAEMIQLCHKELFPYEVSGVIGWVMMEPPGHSFHGNNKEEEYCVVLQCKERGQLCVAKFSMEEKQIICFIRLPMSSVEKIIIGQLGIIIRSTKRLHMRIHYSLMKDTSSYFTFTTVNSVSMEEDKAILGSIAEYLVSVQPSIILQEQKISKKKSLPHQGIVYLMVPNDVDKTPSNSVPQMMAKSNSLVWKMLNSGGTQRSEEEEEEPSPSAPSSPKLLRSPLNHKHSQSFNNLSATDGPLDHLSHKLHPAITVTSPKTKGVTSLYEGLEDENEEGSSSESETELGNLQASNLRVANPLASILGDESTRSDEESGVWVQKGDCEEMELDKTGQGKFSRLKGRFPNFIQKVKSSTSTFLSKHARSQQPVDNASNSPSPQPQAMGEVKGSEVESAANSQRNGGGKQQAKVSSPRLWRKMRRPSPAEPTEEEVILNEARKNSRSRIIYI